MFLELVYAWKDEMGSYGRTELAEVAVMLLSPVVKETELISFS